MIQGSTPTIAPKRRRAERLALPDVDARPVAVCTSPDGSGVGHPRPAGVALDDPAPCPSCWPSSYAARHARHRAASYATTEAQAVTR
jgi:hypothetical protein